MNVADRGQNDADWKGFQNPAPGWHDFEIQEGIEIHINEKDQKQSLKVPFMVVDDENNEQNGATVLKFFPMDLDFGEKMFCDLLVCAGIATEIEDEFPEEDSNVFDEEVIQFAQLKLPGNVVRLKTSIRKVTNDNGETKEYPQIDIIRSLKSDKSDKNNGKGSSRDGSTRRKEKSKRKSTSNDFPEEG